MGRATLDELAVAAGRDPSSIDVTVYGLPADPEVMKRYEEAGANRVTTLLPYTVGEEALADLERIAERILA